MERFSSISMAVVRRLPKYHRYLSELKKNDVKRVSSQELSRITGFTASQIRQDLNCFGGFGQQGYGYNVDDLHQQISKILGLDKIYKTVIVGAGNLGQAIVNYTFFEKSGFIPQAIFDVNPRLIGLKINDIKVHDVENLESFVKDNGIDIGIICTPKSQCQKVAEALAKGGVQAIWNFAPSDVSVHDDIIVENVHLSESLFTISYLLKEREEVSKAKKY
ncbi:Redox-sensing transcriptional repressor Rex [bioreactor metagenome]|uniref:Redox-sensing transcriptional repressor Rex n=1 Tax=bioreactor metagenome TaxID=1076179 RepID=A0A644YL41_9ZZZZ|nr:redox-sensing transcriptional repressor Rex [Lutispora sp.]MEA4964137.1 redox-sensing transcriptional repressor Rex [Lutispora sp.]HCJ58661.1 redox-sensing transcriptional repressor Rex [Clostridiaceae bacterium]